MMPGRKYSANSSYRYGFNGKEKSAEITSDSYDFGARIYDGRIARWLSVDPLFFNFPFSSPYSFAANNPIVMIDAAGEAPSLPPPYRLISFISIFTSSSTDIMIMYSFASSQNTSLSHLQKFLWAGNLTGPNPEQGQYIKNNYNKIKGTVGEAIIYDKFVCGWGNITSQTIAKNPFNRNSWTQAVTTFGSYSQLIHSDKFTDLELLVQVNKNKVFKHEFTQGFYAGFFGPSAMMREKTYEKNTNFVYEVKTNNVDGGDLYTEKNIQNGLRQLLTNQKVINGAVPVLVLDFDYYIAAYKSNPELLIDIDNQLMKKGGGIYTVENLNKDAKEKIGELQKKIKSTTRKTDHYDYKKKDDGD